MNKEALNAVVPFRVLAIVMILIGTVGNTILFYTDQLHRGENLLWFCNLLGLYACVKQATAIVRTLHPTEKLQVKIIPPMDIQTVTTRILKAVRKCADNELGNKLAREAISLELETFLINSPVAKNSKPIDPLSPAMQAQLRSESGDDQC